MNLRHIEAFRAVSLTGSMTEAARRLHTSQPQISRLVSQLEEITCFPLFTRNGSRLTATSEGARFFREVEQTFAGLTVLEAAAAQIRTFSAGRLSVAAMPRLAGGVLAKAVAQFKREYRDVLVSIHSGDAASVHAWISSGQCDMGLAMLYSDTSGVAIRPIAKVECVAIMPTGHPLAAHKNIEPKHFSGQPFISLPTGSALRQRLDAVFSEADAQLNVIVEASLGACICALVSEGLGVSIINPFAAADEMQLAGLEIRPFRPSISLDLVMLFPEHQIPSRLVEIFAGCAQSIISDEVQNKLGGSRRTPIRPAT